MIDLLFMNIVFQIIMSPTYYGKLLHDYFLFDCSRLMSVCQLYGDDNEKLIQKMIDNIFSCQPEYYKDFVEYCEAILKVKTIFTFRPNFW